MCIHRSRIDVKIADRLINHYSFLRRVLNTQEVARDACIKRLKKSDTLKCFESIFLAPGCKGWKEKCDPNNVCAPKYR